METRPPSQPRAPIDGKPLAIGMAVDLAVAVWLGFVFAGERGFNWPVFGCVGALGPGFWLAFYLWHLGQRPYPD